MWPLLLSLSANLDCAIFIYEIPYGLVFAQSAANVMRDQILRTRTDCVIVIIVVSGINTFKQQLIKTSRSY